MELNIARARRHWAQMVELLEGPGAGAAGGAGGRDGVVGGGGGGGGGAPQPSRLDAVSSRERYEIFNVHCLPWRQCNRCGALSRGTAATLDGTEWGAAPDALLDLLGGDAVTRQACS